MQALPQSSAYDGMREDITNKIQGLKESLIHSKPIGARVDACRALVARCQARRDQAQQALSLAQQVMKEADKELADANAKMASIEAELASADEPNSLESMATSMTKVLEEMEQGGVVPATMI
eukprot:8346016-Karenia_brevis.AAC.1